MAQPEPEPGGRLHATGQWATPPDWEPSTYFFFRCYSSEYSDPAKRPKLIVNYTCTGEDPPSTPVVTDDGETTASSTTLQGPAAELANNITESCDEGIHWTASQPITLTTNCLFDNRIDYFPDTISHGSDLAYDPKLGLDGFHIQPNSPCIDAGTDTFVQEADRDIDQQARIRYGVENGTVDIGVDESYGEIWYRIEVDADPHISGIPRQSSITAHVTDHQGQNVDCTVDFQATDGDLDPGQCVTGPDGIAETQLTCDHVAVVMVMATANLPVNPSGSTAVVFRRPCAANGEWPMFMHDPQHTGMSLFVDTTTSESLTLAWEKPVRTPQSIELLPPFFDSSPVVSDGLVVVGEYINSGAGGVSAFPAETGDLVWTTYSRYYMGGVTSTPCVSGGRVYVGSWDGKLYCLELSDGTRVWSSQAYGVGESTSIESSPVVHDSDGEVVSGWPVSIGLGGRSSPAIKQVGGNYYLLVGSSDAGTGHPTLSRVRLDTLATVSLQLDTALQPVAAVVDSSPSVSGNYAYVGTTTFSAQSNLYKVQIEPFVKDDESELQAEVRTTPALGYGYLYAGRDTGHILYQKSAASLATLYTFGTSPLWPRHSLS